MATRTAEQKTKNMADKIAELTSKRATGPRVVVEGLA